MKIDILTIFPEQIDNFLKFGVFRIAQENNLLKVKAHDLRKWSDNKHKSIDDRPYGGGAGMVMQVTPIYRALKDLRKSGSVVIITTPRGRKLDQKLVKNLADEPKSKHLIIICGHYEGVDERVHDYLVDMEVSVGDYVLSGGELPALIICDAVTRLIPGVLGNEGSTLEESFEDNILEYPHYSRPEDFMGWKVPEILLSGDHEKIADWRRGKAIENTKKVRPDMLK